MKQDAFSAGVEPGGLYSSQEIKILICYMLAGVGEPLARHSVLEILSGNGMANFFEAGAAVDELIRVLDVICNTAQIQYTWDSEKRTYMLHR